MGRADINHSCEKIAVPMYVCMYITSRGAPLASCCTRFTYNPSHSYIPAHMHAIRCCKQGCERADLAHIKSSKRVKGTDYVHITRLILQHNLWRMRIYFILFEACDLSNQQAKNSGHTYFDLCFLDPAGNFFSVSKKKVWSTTVTVFDIAHAYKRLSVSACASSLDS